MVVMPAFHAAEFVDGKRFGAQARPRLAENHGRAHGDAHTDGGGEHDGGEQEDADERASDVEEAFEDAVKL